MRGILHDTIVEMFDRKFVYVFLIVTLLVMFIILITGSMDTQFQFNVQGDVNTDNFSNVLSDPLIVFFEFYMYFLVFLTVMATAGILPNMLVRGRAEYFLSKPLSRNSLMMYKFFSILFTYGGVVIISGLLVYATTALVHGQFKASVIYIFLIHIVSLFIWLSILFFTGIQFKSGSMAVMAAFLIWIAQKLLAWREWYVKFTGSDVLKYITDTLYYIIPKTIDMSDMATNLGTGKSVTDWLPLWSSALFAVLLLYVTSLVFNRKNY